MARAWPGAILDDMDCKSTSPDRYRIRTGRAEDLDSLRAKLDEAIRPALVEPGCRPLSGHDSACIVASVEAAFAQALRDRRQNVLVGELHGLACGFSIVDHSDPVPDLRWIVVLPEHVGGGLAQALMDAAVRLCPPNAPLSVVVSAGNRRAIHFFRRNHFVEKSAGSRLRSIVRMRRQPV